MGQLKAFNRSVAVVVGIDAYRDGIATLQTAVADAKAIAALLRDQHGYTVELRTDAEATGARLRALFEEQLPTLVGPDDRLLIYFAGHGTAQDGEDGPEGFLIPQDARSGADARSTLLPMTWLHGCVSALPCRHRLLLLDCCFAGTFRWSSHRSAIPSPRTIYRHRYKRFVDEPAAQVLTSAADDQQALDVIDGLALGLRAGVTPAGHSPFAAAVLAGLAGAADMPGFDGRPDGVITASELYIWVRDMVEQASASRSFSQTPGLWPLPMHGRGEYVFEVPGRTLRLTADPRLNEAANPWRGLSAYDAEHERLFFGRDPEIADVRRRLDAGAPLIAVLGASGTGKSSLIKGGLLPRLGDAWTVIGPLRPGRSPMTALGRAMAELRSATTDRQVLVVDQLEELFTLACPADEQTAFFEQLVELATRPGLSVIVTLRSDFEAPVAQTALASLLADGRYLIPPMSREGLRAVIHGPAELRVLYFEPQALAERLVDEVVALPGGLPLLSFTLAEMYRGYLARDASDRALREEDYVALGGVTGSLRSRATAIHDASNAAEQDCIRQLMLRLVATDGGELARRRATLTELTFADSASNARMRRVVDRLVAGRLLVRGTTEPDDADGGGEPYVEPAHDALVLGWDRVYQWIRAAADRLALARAVWRSARTWATGGQQRGLLWTRDPRLPQARLLTHDLNALEQRFVARSVRLRRRGWWTLAGGVIAVMLALGGAAIYALAEAERADTNAATAESKGLVARAKAKEAIAAAKTATAAERTADAARVRAEDVARVSLVQQVRDDDPATAALILAEIEEPERSTYGLQLLSEAANQPGLLRAALDGHTGQVWTAAFSPDGVHIVTASDDKTARVWRADGAAPPVVLAGHDRKLGSAAFDAAGARVVTASDDGTARIWRADGTGDPIVLRGHTGPVLSATFSPDGERVVTASMDKTARVWRADATGRPVVLSGHRGGVFHAAFSPDGARVVTGSEDKTARVWRADGEGAPVVLSGHVDDVYQVAFSGDGQHVAATTLFEVRLWRSDGAGDPKILSRAAAAAFSPDGTYQAVNSGKVVHLRLSAGRVLTLAGHTRDVSSLGFSADGRRVIATSMEHGSALVWNTRVDDRSMTRVPIARLKLPDAQVRSAALSPDGEYAVTTSHGGAVRVWNVDSPSVRSRAADDIAQPASKAMSVAVDHTGADVRDADGRRVMIEPRGKTARVWRASATDDPLVLSGHTERLISVTFSPDDRRIVTASWDKTARVWRADGKGDAVVLSGHAQRLNAAVFSPDSERVVTASNDKTARVWNADGTGTPIVLGPHHARVKSVAFSPDGERVVTADDNQRVYVWRADGAGVPLVLKHTADVGSAAFTADSKRVVIKSSDRRVWEIRGSVLQARLDAHLRWCLPTSFRIGRLGATPEAAAEATRACHARKGLWHRRP